MLPQAEVYVYINNCVDEITGFIGLEGTYIAGIFVRKQARSKGSGKALLEYVKGKKQELTLNVYRKNEAAVRFYEREGFRIMSERTDEATAEEEYIMGWLRE